MSPLAIIAIVLLVIICSGGFYGNRMGWYDANPYAFPSISLVGLLLIVVLVLIFTGRL